jgi:2,3-bisphosphoglycerate-independent phosphoglycerate mutase
MKGIVIIIDGVGDLPTSKLNDKTPLESAETPNLDFIAARGELGYMYPVKPGFIPESDEAIISIFGNELISSTRGQLEAKGAGVKLVRGDLALRTNFATVDNLKEKNVLDRRAGRTLTTAEAKVLEKAINKIKMPVSFEFISTVQHRGVLVFRGGFSDNITGNDLTYYQGKSQRTDKIMSSKPLDEEDNSQYSANILNEFLEKAHEVLERHPINQERKKRGLLPANYLMVRGAGIEIPKLKVYKNWMAITPMPLEIGFAELSGMKPYSFSYPELKELDAYKNLHQGLEKTCKFAIKILKRKSKDFDYAYIHLKETDLPGHDNKPLEKKEMIEYIDKTLFKFLRKFALPKKIKIAVTADHSTPCSLKRHSADPVPVLLYNGSIPKEKRFNEKESRGGTLGRMMGREFLEKINFLK